jgi:hypothetical protein
MEKPSKTKYLSREHKTLKRVRHRLDILQWYLFDPIVPFPVNKLRKCNLSHPGCNICKKPRYKDKGSLKKKRDICLGQ